jgi:hypothetical protein
MTINCAINDFVRNQFIWIALNFFHIVIVPSIYRNAIQKCKIKSSAHHAINESGKDRHSV